MLVGDRNLWFELQSPYAKDFIDSKLEFINSNSVDPRFLHIRRYLKTVHSLSFDKVPNYASLSKELSKIDEPIIEAVAKLKTDVSLKLSENLKQTNKEVIIDCLEIEIRQKKLERMKKVAYHEL